MARDVYGDARTAGARVHSVDSGAAALAGLRSGDIVVAVDIQPIADVIDWMWLTDEPSFVLTIERDGELRTLEVVRTSGEPLGVEFASPVFDGIRECDNACAFCFVSQLPAGLRPSLYVRDDDYRLSFLSGNFVTLTNLTDADIARIVTQRLSPLFVSVHTVDPEVRARLVCATVEDRALEHLDTLLAAGIEVHVQIVLVPGVNDAAELDRTLEYLGERPGILSVGIVPVGVTAHQRRIRAAHDAPSAQALVAQVGTWQQRMRPLREVGWVYAADEFYLLAGEDIPHADMYDDFPQYENGIGMIRAFMDEWSAALAPWRSAGVDADGVVLVTGEMFAPVLSGLLAGSPVRGARVLAVRNRLFGGNVAVTGLLSGADIIRAVTDDGGTGRYLVPDVVVNSDGLLLDDVPADTLGSEARADVTLVGADASSLVHTLTTGGVG